jgi:hypothetical protein
MGNNLLEQMKAYQSGSLNEFKKSLPFLDADLSMPFGFGALLNGKKLILEMDSKDNIEFIELFHKLPFDLFDPLSLLLGYRVFESLGRDDYREIITGKIDRISPRYLKAMELIKAHDDSVPLKNEIVLDLPPKFKTEK